jgi:glycosyltransferase involved in cell wall biosynthesis
VKLLWVTAKRLGSDLASTTQLAVTNSLSKKGWKVTIIAPKGGIPHQSGQPNETEKMISKDGNTFFGVKRSRKPGLGWLTFGRDLKKNMPTIVNQGDFDVALVEWQAVAGSHKALVQSNIPWLIVDRSPPVFRSFAGRLQWFEYRRAYKLASTKGASGSVPKSQALADWNRQQKRIVEPITILEAGVDVSKFKPSNFTGVPTIVHHGQLDQEREIMRLVDIGSVIAARGIDFKMRIAGTGNCLTELQKTATQYDWLEVLGPLHSEQVPQFLASGHVAAFPLPDDEIWRLASPLKVREWAAAGLPMVLSNITPHQSIGQRSWVKLIDHNAPLDDWANQIEELFKADLINIGKKARNDAEREFDWQQTTEPLHLKLTELAGL